MSPLTVVEAIDRIYTTPAYMITLISGLLSIMLERFLFVRRGYRREAAINAAVGWTYLIGGTVLYFALWLLHRWV